MQIYKRQIKLIVLQMLQDLAESQLLMSRVSEGCLAYRLFMFVSSAGWWNISSDHFPEKQQREEPQSARKSQIWWSFFRACAFWSLLYMGFYPKCIKGNFCSLNTWVDLMLVQDANVNNTKFCPQGVQDSWREKLLLICLWYFENQGVSMFWA